MLIRVVLAVNDFILPAGFSEKSLKGALDGEACRQLFYRERGFWGMPRSVFSLAHIASGFKPSLRGRCWLSLLLFRQFSFNFLI
jgi:hypothetical protein